jgi:hypothetical protein
MRKPWVLPILLAMMAVAGCGRVKAPNFAMPLKQWLDKQTYSVWEADWDKSRAPAPVVVGKVTGGNLAPANERGPEPRRPDGLSLGNRHIYAAIGCADWDTTQITQLYGDRKTTRALANPLTMTLETDSDRAPLASAPRQTIKRILASSISVASAEMRGRTVTAVDFAPMQPELNALVRLVMVENQAGSANLAINLASGPAEIKAKDKQTVVVGGRLAILSDHNLEITEIDGKPELHIRLGKVGKGEKVSLALFFVPMQSESAGEKYLAEVRKVAGNPVGLLQATLGEWQNWRAKAKVPQAPAGANNETRHMYDLMDGILCMIKSHIGFEAIHTGALRYPHTRAWVRDNYWVQRALLEAGLRDEAKLNLDFFFSAWQKSGLSSFYEIADKRGQEYGNVRVELPHYLVLMVKDAEALGGIDAKPYWPMVKGCLDKAEVGENGLQPINGDETWLLAAGVNQLDYMLDNSLLLSASATYGTDLARRMGDSQAAEKYSVLAVNARKGLVKFYTSIALNQGGPDPYPCAGVIARQAIWDVNQLNIRAGLTKSLVDLSYPEGIRAYSLSHVVDGGTPGYFLYALYKRESTSGDSISHSVFPHSVFPLASYQDLSKAKQLVTNVLDGFCAATGDVWELQSVTDPRWGLEKRRLWDSAVLLMGLLAYSQNDPNAPQLSGSMSNFIFPSNLSAILDGDLAAPIVTLGKNGANLINTENIPTGFTIYQKDSAAHARELASQLARHLGSPQPINEWKGELPTNANVIIIAPNRPQVAGIIDINAPNTGPLVYLPSTKGILIWVKNTGNVFSDLKNITYELFRGAIPQRPPAAFPDSDLAMAKQIGETPSGVLPVKVTCDKPINIALPGNTVQGTSVQSAINLEAKGEERTPGNIQVHAEATPDKLVVLTVSARGGPEARARVAITFPVGYWVVEARNINGFWDRAKNPIDELHNADGSRTFVFQVQLGGGESSFTMQLARPAVKNQ